MADPESVIAAFPKRPIRLARPRGTLRPILGKITGALLMAALAGFVVWNYLPHILNDQRLASAGSAPVLGGVAVMRWRMQAVILYDCTLSLRHTGDDGRLRVAQQYLLMFGRPDRDMPMQLRHAAGDGNRVGTNHGVARIVNRWITLAICVLVLLGGAATFLLTLGPPWHTRRAQARLARAARPAVAKVIGSAARGGGVQWTFAWNYPGRPIALVGDPWKEADIVRSSVLPRKTEPLWLDRERDLALAMVNDSGDSRLMDEKLTLARLNETERASVMAAIRMVRAARRRG